MNNDIPDTHINDVYAAVGAPLLSFLSPRDIFAVSQTTHYANGVVTENLFNILRLQQQQPRRPALLSSSDYNNNDTTTSGDTSVDIIYKHSFTERAKLVECLLDKIRIANLRYIRPGRLTTTETLDETSTCVREDINDATNWLKGDGGATWYGSFRSDPNEI